MFRNTVLALTGAAALSLSTTAEAGFDAFVIREGGGNPPTIQPNNTYVSGATEFIIDAGSMKAALGSNDVNGVAISDLTQMTIVRYDDTTRFAAGSGPAVGPYINIWVTDGLGNYAVIANEPSNGAFQPCLKTPSAATRPTTWSTPTSRIRWLRSTRPPALVPAHPGFTPWLAAAGR